MKKFKPSDMLESLIEEMDRLAVHRNVDLESVLIDALLDYHDKHVKFTSKKNPNVDPNSILKLGKKRGGQ